jgi:K+-sensing histidine kinase KdpD
LRPMMRDLFSRSCNTARRYCDRAMALSLVSIVATTAAIWALEEFFGLQPKHLVFIYCIPTTLIASRFGNTPSILATILSGMAAIYFIYEPRFSFRVVDPVDLVELLLFALLAILASRVVYDFATHPQRKDK